MQLGKFSLLQIATYFYTLINWRDSIEWRVYTEGQNILGLITA